MRQYSLIKALLLYLFIFLASQQLHAQDLLKGKDLSQIRVDQLSDADILKLKNQLNGANMTIDQAEGMALGKGMSASEFAKLKQRISGLKANESGVGKLSNQQKLQQSGRTSNNSDSLDIGKYDKVSRKPLINPLIFGSELYTSIGPNFEPNLKIATPLNYILGPEDQLTVSVYGIQQYDGELIVSPEGSISVPNVGQIKVSGLTIEAATEKIRSIMGNSVYPYLKSGGSKLSVSLTKIRSIKVLVIGSNFPGTITVSSFSTVFGALYLAGGPTEFGSFREIELWRNNKLIKKIDLYRLMSTGDQSDNIGLKDNDVIRIPTYKKRVELQNQVKRPGIFEVLPGETFSDILAFASGFTDTAYEASVKIFQKGSKERMVHDLYAEDYSKYQPQSGDVFSVSKILNRFENRVRINGAVFRPDAYELKPGMRVADLIRKADGLKEDAYTGRGQIIRLQEDLSRSIVAFDIRKAMAGDDTENSTLKREDEVLISSVLELRDSFKVIIQGEIRMPGQYDYVANLTLKDLIIQAGGFTDAAFNNIEIARLIIRDSIAPSDNRASSIINTSINSEDLSTPLANIKLQPFDVITVRRKAGYTIPETVIVSGQVQYPGPYALKSRNERVSTILKRSGGFTPDAFPEGAYLKRFKTDLEIQRSQEVVKKLQRNTNDTTGTSTMFIKEDVVKTFDQIPLDLPLIMQKPESIEDLVVRAGDELYIPKFNGQVIINGSVLLSTQVPYQKGNSLKDYINEAGGFSGDAWKKKAYVVYANGKGATTKHLLFFKFYPSIKPGSEIVVPKKPERRGANTGEVIGIASALASLAGVVIAILKL